MPNPTTNRIAVASGMIAEQAGSSIEAALQPLEETAQETDCTVEELADVSSTVKSTSDSRSA